MVRLGWVYGQWSIAREGYPMTLIVDDKRAITQIMVAITEAVMECGDKGMGEGQLYMALTLTGLTLNGYERLMSGMLIAEVIVLDEYGIYRVSVKGREFVAAWERMARMEVN